MSEPKSKTKAQARDLARSRLATVSQHDAAAWSTAVCAHIKAWPVFEIAKSVMLFLPLKGEADLRPLGREAIRSGKVVCVPRADWQAKTMSPVPVSSLETGLTVSRHGINEPPVDAPRLPVSELDLVIVPGLAFDPNGGRLGRGAGFYDRFLADPLLRAITCGVGFEIQLLDNLPKDRWDMPLHAIATERRLFLTPRTPPAAA